MSVLRHCPILDRVDQVEIFDHFTWYVTAHQWTSTVSDSGTVAVGDAAGGILAIASSDGNSPTNDETYVASTAEVFLLAANKKIYGAAYLQFTEANTDDAGVYFGFMNAVGANTLVDSTLVPKSSFSGAVIHKVIDSTVWKATSSVGSTQTTSTSTTSSSSSSYQLLEIIGDTDSALGNTKFTFRVNGRFLRDSNNAVIRHTVAYASATEMQLTFGVKSGGANTETLNVDWVYGAQKTIAG